MADIPAGIPPSALSVSNKGEPLLLSQTDLRPLQGNGTAAQSSETKLPIPQLRLGTIVTVTVVRGEGGVFILRAGGFEFSCALPPELAKTSAFNARVVSETPLLLMPEKHAVEIRRSELLTLAMKDIAAIAKDMAAVKLSVITAGELRQLIRNSGLFLENKLAKGVPVTGDTKLNAGIQGNQTVWDGITRMQLASILLEDGIFSFFGLDELEDDGIIHIRREKYGASFYMKMTFTQLGSTVLSIVPTSMGSYIATVRTERDISEMLSNVKIIGAAVRWQRLRKNDIEIFDIKHQIIGRLGRFDITV